MAGCRSRRPDRKRWALLGGVSLSVLTALGANSARAQSGPFVYVPNSTANNVSVVDTTTNTVVSTIAVGSAPVTAAVRGDEALVYVANAGSDTVSVINTATNAVIATIPVGATPDAIAVSPNGTTVYVVNVNGGNVSVINAATNTVTATIAVGSFSQGAAVSPNGATVYVTNRNDNNVSVINTATNTVIATISVGNAPQGIAVSPNSATAYVANIITTNVSVINTATNTVTATVGIAATTTPFGIAISPNGATADVTNNAGSNVQVINTATNTVIATVTVGSEPYGITFSPDGTQVYVTNADSNKVSVIDTATDTVIATIVVGTAPGNLGICSNGNALLAAGLTFKANTSGALACTLASGPSGALGPVFTGGTMQFAGANIASALPITLMSQGGTFDTDGNNATLSGTISGPGGLTKIGLGTLTLSGAGTYAGPTAVNAGTLQAGAANAFSPSSAYTVASGAALDLNGFNQTIGGLSGVGAVINSDGAIPTLTIAFGGTFAPGTVGMPGTSMSIAGNLVLSPGATYAVYLNPTTSSFATITGTATLTGATANASFASGSYVSKKYTILTATGGLGGTTFAGLTTSNLPSGASDSLSYDANDVFLNLTTPFSNFTGLNINQQNVANALTNYFNATGGIPGQFFNLSPGALTQIDGEAATGAERGAFKLMDQFLALMLDPFVDGRNGARWFGQGGGSAQGFAPEQTASLPPDIALAYAGVLKAPPSKPSFDQRWSAWGSAFGGSSTAEGNATIGSNTVTARDYGFAAGMDYHYSPDTVTGFALAGGGTNWGLAQGLGGGRSDAFQAGLYGVERLGAAYIGADLAFANHWMSTSRIALADQLTASFNGQSWGGRVETGYRYAWLPTVGITPYAAVQAQRFNTPRYSETDVTGGGFGLTYNAMSAMDTRSELGARFDDATVWGAVPLVLRGRVAWAHDWVSNPALVAVFQSLPGASFTVNGARQPPNSALASAAADLRLTANWTLTAKFDVELATGSQTYAGTGTLRYVW